MNSRGENLIKFNSVTKIFEDGSLALKNINLEIEDGEYLYVNGKSGSGKSTFLKLLTKELTPERGTIEVDSWNLGELHTKDIVEYRREIGVVFQDFRLIESINVFDNISYRLEVIGVESNEIQKKVNEILYIVGLGNKAKCMPKELSGGEQQRVAIARACITNPRLLIADEPTANLDYKNSVKVIELFKTIQTRGTSVIVATHDKEIRDYFPSDYLNLHDNMVFRKRKE